MTQQRSHFFLDVDDDVRLTQIFGQTCVLAAQLLVLLIHRMALGLRSRASAESALRGCRWPAHAARLPAATSTSLPGEAEPRYRLVWQRRPRLPAGCPVCIPRCRYAAWVSRPLRDQAARSAANRRPHWLPLHCRVGAAGCPAAPLTEPDLRASHPALWIVVSEDQTKLVRDFHGRIRYAPEVI